MQFCSQRKYKKHLWHVNVDVNQMFFFTPYICFMHASIMKPAHTSAFLIKVCGRFLPAFRLRIVALGVNDAREHLFELNRHQHASFSIAFDIDQLDVSVTCWCYCIMLLTDERNQSVRFIDIVSRVIDIIKIRLLCKGCCCLQVKKQIKCYLVLNCH